MVTTIPASRSRFILKDLREFPSRRLCPCFRIGGLDLGASGVEGEGGWLYMKEVLFRNGDLVYIVNRRCPTDRGA